MAPCIYALIIPGYPKAYFGRAENLHERVIQHKYYLKKGTHHSVYFQRVFDKYGPEILVVVLYEGTIRTIKHIEQFVLDSFFEQSMNCSKDAVAPMSGRNHTEETKKKLSEYTKARIASGDFVPFRYAIGHDVSDKTRQKISTALQGKKLSPEHCEKIRQGKLKRGCTPNVLIAIRKVAASRVGKKRDPEIGKKISAAKKGRCSDKQRAALIEIRKNAGPMSEETKLKISKANKGRKFSDEHRSRLSAAAKSRKVSNFSNPEVQAKAAASRQCRLI